MHKVPNVKHLDVISTKSHILNLQIISILLILIMRIPTVAIPSK